METILTKHQIKTFRAEYRGERPGEKMLLIATVRHDDSCGNGHNSFSITGDIYSSKCPNSRGVKYTADGKRRGWVSGGCVHDEIAKRLPKLAPFIKWHSCDATGGPTHYKANALYWAGHCARWMPRDGESANYPANWDHFASIAKLGVLPGDPPLPELQKMTAEELGAWLDARLPAIMVEFRAAVEALGLVF